MIQDIKVGTLEIQNNSIDDVGPHLGYAHNIEAITTEMGKPRDLCQCLL